MVQKGNILHMEILHKVFYRVFYKPSVRIWKKQNSDNPTEQLDMFYIFLNLNLALLSWLMLLTEPKWSKNEFNKNVIFIFPMMLTVVSLRMDWNATFLQANIMMVGNFLEGRGTDPRETISEFVKERYMSIVLLEKSKRGK